MMYPHLLFILSSFMPAIIAVFLSSLTFWLTGCLDTGVNEALLDARTHRKAVSDDEGERLSLGKVQQHMNEGMSGADVIDLLGSPNIVTTDTQRREVWVYDRIFTTTVTSSGADENQEAAAAHLIPGIKGSSQSSYDVSSSATQTSQKTMTVIVKFDSDKKVRDYAYRLVRF